MFIALLDFDTNFVNSSGGIRGIVELTVLEKIEEALDMKVPIQAFFDLIIGTRYVFGVFGHAFQMLIHVAPEGS